MNSLFSWDVYFVRRDRLNKEKNVISNGDMCNENKPCFCTEELRMELINSKNFILLQWINKGFLWVTCGHRAQVGGGRENPLRLWLAGSSSSARAACALNFHFHCWLLSAIHNAKVNSNSEQFGRHENTHQSAKKKKKELSKFLGLFLDSGWPDE